MNAAGGNTTTFYKKGQQLYYGTNYQYRVFDENSDLTQTFKKRFRNQEIGELPNGWMYNTITNRFMMATRAALTKVSHLKNIGGVLFPDGNILDYNVLPLANKGLIYKYQQKSQQPTEYATKLKYLKLKPVDTTALNGDVITKTLSNINNITGLEGLKYFYHYIPSIKQVFKTVGSIKVSVNAVVRFERKKDGADVGFQLNHFLVLNNNTNDIKQSIDNVIADLTTRIDNLELTDSYSNFEQIMTYKLTFTKYRPARGSSFIETPTFITNKKATVNIRNEDEECFKYSVLCALHYDEIGDNHSRVTKYTQWKDELNFGNITFPVKAEARTISKFEELNNISINIFIINDKSYSVNPFIISKKQAPTERQIDLLLITDTQSSSTKSHYVYIRNISRLLSKQYSEHHEAKHICRYCLHGYTTSELLTKHLNNGCATFGEQKTIMPTEGDDDKLTFKNFNSKFKGPFAIYADFEAILEPIECCNNSPMKSWTQKTHKHIPCGFSICGVSNYEDIRFNPIVYRGPDAVVKFYEALTKLEKKMTFLLQKYKDIKTMKITQAQFASIKTVKVCHICEKPFKKGEKIVRDHDHVNGEFRGNAHVDCNINLNEKNWKIPVFFHNLKNYDSHFIISELDKNKTSYVGRNGKTYTSNVSVIANSSEKFVSFSFRKLKFVDTFAFLSCGLDKLVENMKNGSVHLDETFKHTSIAYSSGENFEAEKFNLVLRKGVYPYEYMNSFEKFNESSLPPINKFYSELNENGISEEDYKHAQLVWKTFKIKNMGEYHDLYLKTDTLLLADVFENFRTIAMTSYNLDPSHYLTLPAYAWDVMLKMTKITLKLLTDPDMYIFCERSKRGGVSLISHRYAKANNEHLPDYDNTKENSFITYLDANNLYGWAMSQALPYEGFEWVDGSTFNINTMTSDTNIGYLIECDIEYPAELHDLHSDLPIAPQNVIIQDDELSAWQIENKEKLSIGKSNTGKLIASLRNKTKYVCHSSNLTYYLSLGLKVSHIHKVLKFCQKPWLKQYIDFNTAKRTLCNNDFEKDFYKLMNNAVFGKTMENLRGRVDYELVYDPARLLKVSANPRLSGVNIIRPQNGDDLGLVGMSLNKNEVKLNKPIYVGCSILDLSKIWMYQFHYDYIKTKYGDKAKLLFTDTDSLCYHITTPNLHNDFKDNSKLFDFSDMPANHPLKSNENKKVLGKFKPEELGQVISEFVGIRAKMYSMLMVDTVQDAMQKKVKQKHTGKGIKKCALKRIKHDDYKRCLFGDNLNDKTQMVSFSCFRSIQQQLFTVKVNKVGLCVYDDKKYIIDGVNSLPYGHYKISQITNNEGINPRTA